MAEHLRLANTEAPQIEAGGFVQTETACSILQSLQLIELIDGPAMTMIAGASGVGKTRTLEHFAGQYALGEIYLGHVTFKRGEGKPGDVSEVLFQHFRHWDKANGKSLPLRRDLLLSHRCVSRLRVLLADEAQHLLPDGIEWLRGLCEEAGVAVAFVGDLELPRLITGYRNWTRGCAGRSRSGNPHATTLPHMRVPRGKAIPRLSTCCSHRLRRKAACGSSRRFCIWRRCSLATMPFRQPISWLQSRTWALCRKAVRHDGSGCERSCGVEGVAG